MLSTYADARYEAFVQWKQCIADSQEERELANGGFFSMSEAGKCSRQLAYSYLGYERPPISARTRRVFEHGSMFEDTVRYIIKNNPYGIRLEDAEREVSCDNPPMRGHIDGIIYCDTIQNAVSLINGELTHPIGTATPHHLELKTMAQIGFQNVVRKGMYETQPDYVAQAQCYLHALGLKDTWFIIENKNTNNVVGQVIPYLPDRYQEVENRLKAIYRTVTTYQTVENSELPEKEGMHQEVWRCKYCPYMNTCWELEGELDV